MIQSLGGNSKVYRLFKDPMMIFLFVVILILSFFIVNDQLTHWKTVLLVEKDGVSEIRTKAGNVDMFLKEQHICMRKLDYVSPSPSTIVRDGMKVFLYRMEERVFGIKEKLPYGVKIIKTGVLPRGKRRVILNGRDGIVKKTYKILKKNGIECQRELICRKLIVPPISKIVMVGTGKYRKLRFKNDTLPLKAKFIDKKGIPTLHLPTDILPEGMVVENPVTGRLVVKNDSKEIKISGLVLASLPKRYRDTKKLNFKILR
jgi:hypothetical protein